MNVVASISPSMAELVYSGKKTIAWYRHCPVRYKKNDVVFIFEQFPVRRITGEMHVSAFHEVFVTEDSIPTEYLERSCVGSGTLLVHPGTWYAWEIDYSHKYDTDIPDLHYIGYPVTWNYVDLLESKDRQW